MFRGRAPCVTLVEMHPFALGLIGGSFAGALYGVTLVVKDRPGSAALALGAVALGAGTTYFLMRDTVSARREEVLVTEAPRETPAIAGTGFGIVGSMVDVVDETAAYRYLATIDLQTGNPTAEEALIRIIAPQFPEMTWPPAEGTEAAKQWDFMVQRVAAILDRHNPQPPQRLRVVS